MCVLFFLLINDNNNNLFDLQAYNFFDLEAFISKFFYRLLIFKEKQEEQQTRLKTNYYKEKNQIPHA